MLLGSSGRLIDWVDNLCVRALHHVQKLIQANSIANLQVSLVAR